METKKSSPEAYFLWTFRKLMDDYCDFCSVVPKNL